jgi:hypothetical protein
MAQLIAHITAGVRLDLCLKIELRESRSLHEMCSAALQRGLGSPIARGRPDDKDPVSRSSKSIMYKAKVPSISISSMIRVSSYASFQYCYPNVLLSTNHRAMWPFRRAVTCEAYHEMTY